MSIFNKIQDLRIKILETEELLSLVNDHPFMKISLEGKLADLKAQLESLPRDLIEPKISLLFSGLAVSGSSGIKSDFVSKTIKPLQELIKTQTAQIKFGEVGKRGKAKKSAISELYLTALPTGSFGYELSMLEPVDLFDEEDVGKSINEVMHILEATAKNEEEFEEIIGEMSKRTFNNLLSFFKEVADKKSILKMDSGSIHIELSEPEIKNAYLRINSTSYEEKPLLIRGIFKGIILNSGTFEAITHDGTDIKGKIHESLDDETLTEYNKLYTNEECKIHLQEDLTIFNDNKKKVKYELVMIESIED